MNKIALKNLIKFKTFKPVCCFSTANNYDPSSSHVHFKASERPHPLGVNKVSKPIQVVTLPIEHDTDIASGDHTGRQQNHIWTTAELNEKMATLYHHQPKTITDHVMNKLMYGLYHTFNFVTGFKAENPTVKSIEWRLIVLESIAGVPGFVAAAFRHFRSLRTLHRDHGWIATLLEEAENERMHLLVCLNTFNAGYLTRVMVISAQMVMTPFLILTYMVNPKAMHRFVGYLEETACHTYVTIIKNIETEGTNLNKGWSDVPAPPMAIGYWRLHPDAMWVDTLKCMMADECNHRDVNHTFAEMGNDDPNPFMQKHKENAMHAWRLTLTGEPAWNSPNKAAVDDAPASPATMPEEKK